jgi:hypothetical protein
MTLPRPRSLARRATPLVLVVLTAGTILTIYGAPSGHRHHPPGSIIGKDTPAQIPDDVAYRQVINTIAGLASDPTRTQALEAYFRYMEHTASAAGTAVASARLAQPDRDVLRATGLQLHAQTRTALARGAGYERRALANAAVARLQQELTPRGTNVLHAFVLNAVKPNMKIIR